MSAILATYLHTVITIAFYELEEVKDVLAFCCVIINRKDEEALLRVINIPRRISEETVKKLLAFAEEHSLSLWDSLTNCELENVEAEAVKDFVGLISNLKELVNGVDAYDFLKEVVQSTNLLGHYAKIEDRSELVIRQLLERARLFSGKREQNITDYLRVIALLKEMKSIMKNKDSIILQ